MFGHGGRPYGQAQPQMQRPPPSMNNPSQFDNMLAMAGTLKTPPAWGPSRERDYPFRDYIRDLVVWSLGTDVEPHRQCALAMQRLEGTARALIDDRIGHDANIIMHGEVRHMGDGQGARRIGGLATFMLILQEIYGEFAHEISVTVSYTHLTLPTICSV